MLSCFVEVVQYNFLSFDLTGFQENCDRFVAATFSKLVHFSMGLLGNWPEAAGQVGASCVH